jgi:hypothetical protein
MDVYAVQEELTDIILYGVDPDDNDTLTYAVVTEPSHGTLSGLPPNLTYTAEAGYEGSDSFTFKVNDGIEDSDLATVSIEVSSNHPPVALDCTKNISANHFG